MKTGFTNQVRSPDLHSTGRKVAKASTKDEDKISFIWYSLPIMKAILTFLTFCLIVSSTCAVGKEKPLMKDFVGINAHFKFKPALYNQVCRLVRNYHNLNWDVKKPGDKITIPVCHNKVNWKKHVYGKWVKHGFEVDLCVQFGAFGHKRKDYQNLWQGTDKWLYDYGYKLASYFGPSGKEKLVTSIEIGNEPGPRFDDDLYQRIFKNMAKGIRDADPKIKIVTCTAQAREADDYSKDLRKTFASEKIKKLYDVINVHTYATKPKGEGQSPWDRSYPEDPALDYLKVVDESIRWRDKHAKNKEIWITEFGYDACTPQAMKKREGWAKKLNWQGVTDLQQAQYLLRSIFAFAKRDVDRAYLYFYNDSDEASVHAASGLTRHFKPKPSFWAMKQFYEILGDFRFKRTIKDTAALCIYEFVDDNKSTIWLAWLPSGDGKKETITLPRGSKNVKRIIPMQTEKKGAADLAANSGKLSVGESPVYIIF